VAVPCSKTIPIGFSTASSILVHTKGLRGVRGAPGGGDLACRVRDEGDCSVDRAASIPPSRRRGAQNPRTRDKGEKRAAQDKMCKEGEAARAEDEWTRGQDLRLGDARLDV